MGREEKHDGRGGWRGRRRCCRGQQKEEGLDSLGKEGTWRRGFKAAFLSNWGLHCRYGKCQDIPSPPQGLWISCKGSGSTYWRTPTAFLSAMQQVQNSKSFNMHLSLTSIHRWDHLKDNYKELPIHLENKVGNLLQQVKLHGQCTKVKFYAFLVCMSLCGVLW